MHSNIIIAKAPVHQVYWLMSLKSVEVHIENSFTDVTSVHTCSNYVNDWIIP